MKYVGGFHGEMRPLALPYSLFVRGPPMDFVGTLKLYEMLNDCSAPLFYDMPILSFLLHFLEFMAEVPLQIFP